jgi:hypothetical protein
VSPGSGGVPRKASALRAEGKGDVAPSAGRASHEGRSAGLGRPASAQAAGAPPAVEWTVSPWRDDPGRASLVAIAALALWLLAARLLAGERLLSTLMGVAVLGVLAPGMVPTRCRVDGAGVARRGLFGWDRRAWTDIRRARVDPRGLHVSPFPRRSRLDRFRGLFLPVPRRTADPAALLETLRGELDRHGH